MNKIIHYFIVSLFALLVVSCGDDKDSPSASSIVGTWYGTRAYDNPVGGTKYQYLTIDLYQDGTGKMEYETPVSYSLAYFSWNVSGNTVRCQGGYANTEGDVETDFNLELRIDGNRLLPQNRYTAFILTQDNSITTNGSGEEILDYESLLKGVWILSSRDVVINISNNGKFKEYVLQSPGSNIYTEYNEYDYIVDEIKKEIIINHITYEIKEVDESHLVISNNNKTLRYTAGSDSDIPTEMAAKNFIEDIHWYNDTDMLYLGSTDSKVSYIHHSNVNVGSLGETSLVANGSYIRTGNMVYCHFTDVSWDGGAYEKYKNIFPGWKYHTPCDKTIVIVDFSSESLQIRIDGGNIIYLHK